MLILVCGSRNWGDRQTICQRLTTLPAHTIIMHGACSHKDPNTGQEISADMLADQAAEINGLHTRAFPADWKQHGKRAGILRNNTMLNQNPDLVIAFQRAHSRGTQHTIDEAGRRGIPVEIHTA